MSRFFRFVVLGYYSPALYMIGLEPWPAPTLAGRWRQWRGRGAWHESSIDHALRDGWQRGTALPAFARAKANPDVGGERHG